MLDLDISDQAIWRNWNANYLLVSERAKKLKSTCSSHCSRVGSYRELGEALSKRIDDRYQAIFKLLDWVIEPPFAKQAQTEFGSGKNVSARKNTLWTDLMLQVATELQPFFKPKRKWDYPGGIPQEAVPYEVYKSVNGILHYSYPHIWTLDKKTTNSIKVRCHNARTKQA
jgi:hypothetical protein